MSTAPLPRSTSNQYLVAELNGVSLPSGIPRIVARSYGGNPWEAVAGSGGAASITCDNANSCSVTALGGVTTRQITLPPNVTWSTLAEVSSWFFQGGFGASKSVLQATRQNYGNDVGRWVRDQQALPPTYTRAYYRKRTNPRLEKISDVAHPTTSPCDIGARWYRYVFEQRDVNQNFTVVINSAAQRFDVRVNGVLRAQVPSFFGGNVSFPVVNLTVDTPGQFILCDAEEGVGAPVRITYFGKLCNITANRITFAQPSMNIIDTTELKTAYQAFADGSLTLSPIIGGFNGAVIVTGRTGSCNIVPDSAGNAFFSYQGQFYKFDQRVVFEDNLVEAPSSGGLAGNNQCPIAPSSILTRDYCEFVSQCTAPPQFLPVDIALNDTTLRAWYTDAPLSPVYVYALKNLRLEDPYVQGPCDTTVSRWLHVADGTCPSGATSLPAGALSSIVNALTNTADKNNSLLRDVDASGANCPLGVGLGAFVEADGSCWQHVHPDTYNVVDATQWVSIHDGNDQFINANGYNPIAQFAVDGSPL